MYENGWPEGCEFLTATPPRNFNILVWEGQIIFLPWPCEDHQAKYYNCLWSHLKDLGCEARTRTEELRNSNS